MRLPREAAKMKVLVSGVFEKVGEIFMCSMGCIWCSPALPRIGIIVSASQFMMDMEVASKSAQFIAEKLHGNIKEMFKKISENGDKEEDVEDVCLNKILVLKVEYKKKAKRDDKVSRQTGKIVARRASF